MQNQLIRILALIFSSMLLPASGYADIFYVDASVSSSGNGSDWPLAFQTLQEALTHPTLDEGDEIWVAGAIGGQAYYPDDGLSTPPTTPPDASFVLVDDVEVYGGFPPGGGDGSFAARDVELYETILSGDIDHDGVLFDALDNSTNLVQAISIGSGTVIDGFTITGATANAFSEGFGTGGGWRDADR